MDKAWIRIFLVAASTGALLFLTVVTSSNARSPENAEASSPSGQWSFTSNNLQVGRYSFRAVKLQDSRVLVPVGFGGANTEAEVYSPATDGWAQTGSLNQARGENTATLLQNGKVLVAGGFGAGASAELYDPNSGTWTLTGAMKEGRTRHQATLLPNGKVLVTGAYQGCMTASAELYDPATGTWSYTGGMGKTRADHISILLKNGKVLVAGGDDDCASPRKTAGAELYDAVTGTFTSTSNMNVPRAHHSAVLLPDGRVLVVGGDNDPDGILSSAEIYDPVTGTWSLTASMHRARFFPLGDGAVLLSDGTVLVGGNDGGGGLATSEMYDPSTRTWTEPIAMNDRHCAAPVVMLDDGRPMIVSGLDCAGPFPTVLLTAEIYSAAVSESDYRLPYPPGISPPIFTTQGNDATGQGSSHHGKQSKAFDFAKQDGTEFPVAATRSGWVFDKGESFTEADCPRRDGEPTQKCFYVTNYIVIVHEPDDGFADLYIHLKQNSILPEIGDWVYRGCQIAVADNTGISTGIHLHFAKEKKPTKTGGTNWYEKTVPVTFSDSDPNLGAAGGIPKSGKSYESSNAPVGPCP